ncbi:T6SS immunity protein Tdi1 domain-containing protein [Flavobacterium sp. HNIBRBA15423]|uniref:T6SS immunity protein Tdi1 domain-containing protein n=1 Tax=Flavobacterium sp. HNIBRBA15423 TaxID=3458683 RepID=UPI00404473D2
MLENFKNHYHAEANNILASEELINEYKEKVPKLLIDIWTTTGLGKYNKGIIELINPKDYESNLWTWLGKVVENYTPFAITGFGELLYYRKLTETDEDICMIDIQYRKIETLVWSMESFFDDFLTNDEDKKMWLREDLFVEAISEKSNLQNGEVFTFVPILAIGGAEEIDYLQKGSACVYQDLVFQMTN